MMATLPIVTQIKEKAEQAERRKVFIERMERKLAYKTALRRQHRRQFLTRLQRAREW